MTHPAWGFLQLKLHVGHKDYLKATAADVFLANRIRTRSAGRKRRNMRKKAKEGNEGSDALIRVAFWMSLREMACHP